MANKQLSVDLVLNSMGFKQGIDEAKKGTEEYVNAVKLSDKNIKDLNKAFNIARREAKALSIAFNSLSAAEQQTAQGQALQRQMQEVTAEAGRLQDIISDTNATIKALASDTANLDAFKEAMDIGKSAATAYAGALAKLTGDEKAMKDMLANITMIQGGFNTAIKISNALEKQSAIMTGIRRLQMAAATKATIAQTTATKGATIAQRVFNAVAKANPYVLLATVILGAAAAITTYMFATKDATKAEEEAQEETEKLEKVRKAASDAYASETTKLMSSYGKLKAQWEQLRTEGEKTQWIKENQTEFKNLGISINNIKDAEKWLVENSNKVVTAFNKRAEAAAHAARIQELYSQKLAEEDKILEINAKYEKKKADLRPQMNMSMEDQIYRLNQQRINEILEVRKAQHSIQQKINTETQAEVKKLSEAETILGKMNDHKNDSNNLSKQHQTRYEKLKKTVSDIEKKIEDLDENAPNFKQLYDNLQEKLYKAQQEVEKFERTHGMIRVDIQFPDTKTLLDGFKAKVKELKDATNKDAEKYSVKIKTEFEQTVNSPINEQSINNIIDKAINPDKFQKPDYSKLLDIPGMEKEAEKLIKMRDDILAAMTEINKKFGSTAEGKKGIEELAKAFDKVNAELDDMSKKADKIDLGKLRLEGAKSVIGNLGDVNGAIKGVHDSWASMIDDWEDMSTFEKITSAFDNVISTIETVISTYEGINKMMELFGQISQATAAQKVAADQQEMSSEIGKLGVKQAGAIAGATEAGSSLPFPANLAAIAAGIAAVVAAFAMVFSCFAEGGIVPGNSFAGDKIMARLNSGEMVLNTRQQKNLFNMLDGVQGGAYNAFTGSSVSFKLKGEDIYGSIKNYKGIHRLK